MSNVISAEVRFEKANNELKTNMFVIHHTFEEVSDFGRDAIGIRTEVIKPVHSEQFMVTGIVYTHIEVTRDGYFEPVRTLEIGEGYSSMAESITDMANDQGLLNFMCNGAPALYMMVLGVASSAPEVSVDCDVFTVGSRLQDGTINEETYNVHWEDLQGFIVGHLLGQCCCGRPQDVLKFCHDAIEHLGMEQWRHGQGQLEDATSWKNRLAAEAKYGSGPLYYVWHNLENLGYLEHGSSAPGWLTGEGEHLLALMQYEISEYPEVYAEDE